MARQWMGPDGAVIDEDGEKEYMTPTGAVIGEDQAAAGGAIPVRHYYDQLLARTA